jgi:phage terminase large subunit-like protein
VGVTPGERVFPDLEVFHNQTAKLLATWVTRPMFDWQTPEYYAEQASTLTPDEFDRMHRNQWVSPQSAFVPLEWWDSLQAPLPPMRPYQQVVIGMDAAVVGDCFALVAVSREPDGNCHVRRVRIWTPPANGKIVFRNPANKDDPTTPEGVLRAWCREWRVAEVAYDPYQLEDLATSLYAEGVSYFREFLQGAERLTADKTLFDVIRDGRIFHDGDETLRTHMSNANQQVDKETSKLRIVKRSEQAKVDAVVALSMAVSRALYLNIT